MQLTRLLDVFLRLVDGVVPTKLQDPMRSMAEEIQNELNSLHIHAEILEDKNQDLTHENKHLEDKLNIAQDKLRSASINGTDNIPANILRRLILDGGISNQNPVIQEEIAQHYRDTNNKISCIKHYRQITGLGLKECKDQVDSWIGHVSNSLY